MTPRAPVDQLRALPYPLLLATLGRLERELGPEGVAALRYELDARGRMGGFWTREAQRLPDPDEQWSICVFAGENGSGKTWCGTHLFLREILSGRARWPRIIAATGAALESTVIEGASGIEAWMPRGVPWQFERSKGHEGLVTISGVKVLCCSADAPGQNIGASRDLDFRDDPAGWIETCGAVGASKAWATASRSLREGLMHAIVSTTPEGVEFIDELLKGRRRGLLLRHLGRPEDNAGNLAPGYLRDTVADMREAGTWTSKAGISPFAAADFARARLDVCPRLIQLGVAIDPSRSAGAGACEVGIVGGGLDERDVVHVRHDRSGVLDAGQYGWPAVAWDLAEELQREHPGAPVRFILEANTGSNNAELLRAEERQRRKARGLPGNNVAEIVLVKASKNKCERAKLPAKVMGQGQVRIGEGLGAMEGQLRALTPEGKKSDRADAMVHLVRNLAGLSDEKAIERAATEEEEAAAQAAQTLELAAIQAAARQARAGVVGEVPLIKVEGAPPGDSRYAGPPPRVMGRGGWRTRKVM